MKKIILLFILISGLAFGQTIPFVKLGEKIELNSKEKYFKIDSLKVNDIILTKGSLLKLGNPVNNYEYKTVFVEHFTKNTMLKNLIGMYAPYPLIYKNNDIIIDDIVLVNIKGKQSIILNFNVDNMKGFTFFNLSSKNGEIIF